MMAGVSDLTDDQLDQLAECLPDCIEIYGPYRPRHAPECRHDDLAELVAEVRRLREAVDYRDERLARWKSVWRRGRDQRLAAEAERDRLRDGIRLHRTRLGPMAVEADRRLYALLCDGIPLDNSCPVCGGGPVVDGVCRDDHHHDDQEDHDG